MPNKILLVDDDSSFREEFRESFDLYDVIEAGSGEEAINILKKPNQIDLVILDVNLPGIRGTEVLKEIKNIDPELGIVIMTGFSTEDVAIESLKNRANDYLEKPLDIKRTKEVIDDLLDLRAGVDASVGLMDKIGKVKNFIERNCYKKISLKDAADAANLSPKYLSRKFKENTGLGFNEYRLEIKNKEAMMLLENTSLNIDQISYKLGYQNTESFTRVFKSLIGQNPSEYRKKYILKNKNHILKPKNIDQALVNNKSAFNNLISEKSEKLAEAGIKKEKSKWFSTIDTLASTVAHDLRNALGVIRIATYNIKRKDENSAISKHIEKVEKKVTESDDILKNFLFYSQLRTPKFEKVKIYHILKEAIDGIKSGFPNKDIVINEDVNDIRKTDVRLDPMQIRKLFDNMLIHGYTAFDNSSGEINISATLEKRKNRVVINFKFKQMALSSKNQENGTKSLFNNKISKMNCGILVCYRIVNLHGGDIGVETTKKDGTVFSMRFPLEAKKI